MTTTPTGLGGDPGRCWPIAARTTSPCISIRYPTLFVINDDWTLIGSKWSLDRPLIIVEIESYHVTSILASDSDMSKCIHTLIDQQYVFSSWVVSQQASDFSEATWLILFIKISMVSITVVSPDEVSPALPPWRPLRPLWGQHPRAWWRTGDECDGSAAVMIRIVVILGHQFLGMSGWLSATKASPRPVVYSL